MKSYPFSDSFTSSPEYFKREKRPPYFRAYTKNEGYVSDENQDDKERGDKNSVSKASMSDDDNTVGKSFDDAKSAIY